jgi:succinate dehydrogenase hydrophobic anchor subunit
MNTKQILTACTLAFLLAPCLSFAVANYITLPEGMMASVLEYTSQMFTDVSLLIILAIGLPVGFWILRKVISLVRVR